MKPHDRYEKCLANVEAECAGFHERLKSIMSGWHSESAFAREANLSQSGLNRIIRTKGYPTLPVLLTIAKTANVSVEWLATGKESSSKNMASDIPRKYMLDIEGDPVTVEDFVFVPRYDAKLGVRRSVKAEPESTPLAFAFNRRWVDSRLRAIPEDLTVVVVHGDAMSGVLEDQDYVVVDCSQKSAPVDGVYVIQQDGHLIIKRVQRMPGGKLLLSSANGVYQPFTVDLNNMPEGLKVVGRIIWFSRQIV